MLVLCVCNVDVFQNSVSFVQIPRMADAGIQIYPGGQMSEVLRLETKTKMIRCILLPYKEGLMLTG